jgi:hypothetical protein
MVPLSAVAVLMLSADPVVVAPCGPVAPVAPAGPAGPVVPLQAASIALSNATASTFVSARRNPRIRFARGIRHSPNNIPENHCHSPPREACLANDRRSGATQIDTDMGRPQQARMSRTGAWATRRLCKS